MHTKRYSEEASSFSWQVHLWLLQNCRYTYNFHRTAGTLTTFTELQVHLRLSQNCWFTYDSRNCRYTYDFHRPVGSPMTFTELQVSPVTFTGLQVHLWLTELQVHLWLSQNCRFSYEFHRTAGPWRKPKIYSDELLQYGSHTGCPATGAILPQLQICGHLSRASHSSYSLKPKSSSQPAWPAGNTLISPSCEQTWNKTLITHLNAW